MGASNLPIALFSFSVCILLLWGTASAQPRPNYYKDICPDVESIVRKAIAAKVNQTFVTVPAIIRLFFHDCFVSGCDASVIVASTPRNKAEKDHPDNLSLAGDGFDAVIKAKAAVDAVPRCKNKVSCADILALATRDVINLAGGPSYTVELGRLDGLSSTAASVEGNLPKPSFNLKQLNAMFGPKGLNENDMIALSACHTVGFAHCSKISNRIYNFSRQSRIDPSLNKEYAAELERQCPRNVDPRIAIDMDPISPRKFDNAYFKNLQQQKGLFTSDQALYAAGTSSRRTVDNWAGNNQAFNAALITALTKLGRLGVKTGKNGNIRFDCGKFN